MGVANEIDNCAYAVGSELVPGQFKHSAYHLHLRDIIQVFHINPDFLEGFQLSFLLPQIRVALYPRSP